MSQHIEDYLIGLGFDLNSEDGEKYLKTSKDIEKANSNMEKNSEKSSQNSKSRTASNKNEADSLKELQGAFKSVDNMWMNAKSGNVLGTFSSAFNSVRALKQAYKEIQNFAYPQQQSDNQNKQNNTQSSSTQQQNSDYQNKPQSTNQQQQSQAQPPAHSETPEQPQVQNLSDEPIDVRNVQQANDAFDDLGRSVNRADVNTAALNRTMRGTFGTDTQSSSAVESAAGATGGDTAAVGGGVAAAGAAVGVVALVAAAAVGIYSMADGVANTNIQVQSLAAQMWITDSAALKLSNTLSAMGKSTADLSTIALNPALREQFETLQEFQSSVLKLPDDFTDAGNAWTEKVQTPISEVKEILQNIWQTAGTDFEKKFADPINYFLKGFEAELLTIDNLLKGESLSKSWQDALNSIAKESKSSSSTTAQNQAYTIPTSSTTAPNSPSNSTTKSSVLNYSSQPHIVVNANSSDPQTIAQATASAVAQQNNEAALLKMIQGVSR